jgi:tetratricopeptide (TPR) repeat protein
MKQFFNLIKSVLKFNYSEVFQNILKFFSSKFSEIKIMKEKLGDLERTNFDLGVRRMKEKHFGEAIFRFKIVKKFWPKNKEAYLKLIECLMIKNKKEDAIKVAEDLFVIDSSYKDKVKKILAYKA